MARSIYVSLTAFLVVAVAGSAAAELQVSIDTSGGSVTLADTDGDGVIDFDGIIGTVLEARGRVKQAVEGINAKLAIAPSPLAPDALFRNVSATQQTITVTAKSGSLPVPIAAPLGWDVFYNAVVDDPIDLAVDVPSHSVRAFGGGGTVSLGTLIGIPLAAPYEIYLEDHGVDPVNASSDAWIVWTFTLGPNDEFRVPSDGGFDGESIQVNVFSQSQKCTDKMNKSARRVMDTAQKLDTRCVASSDGAATSCVDATDDVKTIKKQRKLYSAFQALCDPAPAWGVNPYSCCTGGGTNDGDLCLDASTCGGAECSAGGCIAEPAERGANELTHDLFGPTVTASSDGPTRRCQRSVSKASGKLLSEHWKAFRLCKRDAFATIIGDADLIATCLQPEPDPKAKIAKREGQLSADIQAKCLDKGVINLGAEFPGACGAEPDATFGTCLAQRARCRFCRTVNDADAIVPPLACDSFDDGAANASCLF